MNTMTVSCDGYKEEIDCSFFDGNHNGISQVMQFLESGLSLKEFLGTESDKFIKDPKSHWYRIAKAANRELVNLS
jgi:hypothetical protein